MSNNIMQYALSLLALILVILVLVLIESLTPHWAVGASVEEA